MGVFLCINCKAYNMNPENAIDISDYKSLDAIETDINNNPSKSLFILLGKAENKTKKKAEQIACKEAIDYLRKHSSL